jgi:transposase InsO family protein
MGTLRGQRWPAELKGQVLAAIDQAVSQGVPALQACEMVGLPRARYYAWKERVAGVAPEAVAVTLEDRPAGPAPGTAPHRLREEEKEAIGALLREEQYADLSIPQLAIVASEEARVQASMSTFYRQAHQQEVLRPREVKTPVKKAEKPQVHPTGPNQVWSWDLSYLPFFGAFLYLVVILDVYSRKITGWKLCFHATVDQVKQTWDAALAQEGLLDRAEGPKGLEALSDHGSQMTAQSMAEFFRHLGIDHLFARYQTPTDNAWIETWFRLFKYDWLRFQEVLSFHQLEALIGQFVIYYNERRYHGAIGYVTPQQRHIGQDEAVRQARQQRQDQARQLRLEKHRPSSMPSPDILEKAA